MKLPLHTTNILIILGGILLIAFGYILMSTEQFIDAKEFSLSLYVSPPLIIIGHIVVAIGIVLKTKKADDSELDSTTDVKL